MPGVGLIKRVARFAKDVCFLAIGEGIRLFVPRGPGGDCLVLKIDALGDLFIWLGAGIADVSQVARQSGTRSVIAVRKELAEFVAGLGLFDEVWPVDAGRFITSIGYRTRLLAKFRRRGFSRVLQVRTSRQFLLEDSIVRVSGAQEVRGVVGDRRNLFAWEAALGDGWYEPIATLTETGHEAARVAVVTRALTGHAPKPFELELDDVVLPAGLSASYAVLAPGAGWRKRQWPAGKFIEAAQRIRGIQWVVTGTRGEAALGERIAQATGGLNLCGIGVREVAALIRNARLVLANESGLAHVAAYFGVPSVTILGGGHYGWFMPYPENARVRRTPDCVSHAMDCFGCNWHCRYQTAPDSPMPCIAAVETDRVVRRIAAVLDETAAPEKVPDLPEGLKLNSRASS